ncbi:MAG: GIY-YIG nuclease family protein [Ectothiorhodospiraceae bacterium]|nr:GIY-YIG nuclease family protein [Ectothiorhodospiraceae bacterium]MCH8506882.1 GIY-YIG nuclease family protein [Ectothiorhodospiraceae bacterium]
MGSDRTQPGLVCEPPLSYQLLIWVERSLALCVGALGEHRFEAGLYCYTGSARRHPLARLRRHLSRDKRVRWHIDYLLVADEVQVLDVGVFRRPECVLNQQIGGQVPVPGFGASDCANGCGSHLRFLGKWPWSHAVDDR